MIPVYAVSVLVSLGMIAHCIKTGRSRIWVYVLILLMSTPFIGSALYAASNSFRTCWAHAPAGAPCVASAQTLDPEGDLRRAENR